MRKIIVINGSGEAGKDSLIVSLENAKYLKSAYIRNISSIDPIVNIWENSKKTITDYGCELPEQVEQNTSRKRHDKETRLLLSTLKDAYTKYIDLSMKYVLKESKKFVKHCIEEDIEEAYLFIHIREPNEIGRFVSKMWETLAFEFPNSDVYVKTLLVVRDSKKWGNKSDDNVDNYHYDAVYDNRGKLNPVKFYTTIKEM